MPHAVSSLRKVRGFTLIELVVTMAVIALLAFLTAPSIQEWVLNTRTRNVADDLQNGLRLAQAEAVRRGRQTVFYLTNDAPGDGATAVANGRNWSLHSVPLIVGEPAEFIRGASLGDATAGVGVTGPVSICFSSLGSQVVNNNVLVPAGADCSATAARNFDVSLAGSTRRLRVTLSLSGQVRMCDRDKVLSATHPDGCAP